MIQRLTSLVVAGFLAIPASSLFQAVHAEAAPKFAVVDVTKVFNEYKKAKDANIILRERQTRERTYLSVLRRTVSRLNDQVESLRIELQSSMDDGAKKKLEDDLRGKREELAVSSQILRDKAQEATRRLSQFANQKRLEILREIREEIKAIGKEKKVVFVFDISGRNTANVPTVVYNNCPLDITEEVIKRLNQEYSEAVAVPKTEEKSEKKESKKEEQQKKK